MGNDSVQYNSLTRREFLRGAGAAALSLLARGSSLLQNLAPSPSQLPHRKPNVIFIIADDLGYGDLGCYGQGRVWTPSLDRIAAEGMRFTRCYAASTVCAPSRWGLMTGLHTGHARTCKNEALLYPEDYTVAELLRSAGYRTMGIGKWSLGDPGTMGIPTAQGFDHWFGYLEQVRAHDYYPEYLWRDREMWWIEGNEGGRKEEYSHDLFTEEALNFIQRNQCAPFFLYLAYTIPHANNELYETTGDGMEVPSDEPYSDQPWPQVEKNFAAMITRMDRDVGRLLEMLREWDLDRDTILFFTSDNGPHQEGGHRVDFFNSSGRLRGFKRDLYEGGIRVPMLVRWPGTISPGAVSDQVWASWDFLATAADVAGVAAPPDTDGISVLPTLLGQPQRSHEYLYWAFRERGHAMEAVQMGDWKGIRRDRVGEIELYDLREDQGETQNVAGRHPGIVCDVQHIMDTCVDSIV